jgi:hypothetical protein
MYELNTRVFITQKLKCLAADCPCGIKFPSEAEITLFVTTYRPDVGHAQPSVL